MATVYLADDLKLDRKVAVKVLRPELAAVVGAERFLAEIRTTANLQHPHILALHDSGEAAGFLYYVMPYVEGESLRTRLDREQQLPVDEAVRLTTALAAALDYAHRHGVVHRDIKPANILLHDGEPMVADFGIALAVGNAGGDRLTETGLSLGTPQYMSPEQAMGDKPVGPAADVWALGCVLYEMLAGEAPYTGKTLPAIMGKIATAALEPVRTERPSVPGHVDRAVSKALEKLPADRFTGAQDFARALGDEGFRYGERDGRDSGGAGVWRPVALVAGVAAAVFAGVALWPSQPSAVGSRAFMLNVQLPDTLPMVFVGEAAVGAGQAALALSPNGTLLAFVGPRDTTTQLYLRSLADGSVRAIPGTEGAFAPFFAPNGEWIAYFADRRLWRIRPNGDGRQQLAEAFEGQGGTWSDDGRIYFVPYNGGPLVAWAPDGTEAEVVPARPAQWSLKYHPSSAADSPYVFLTCYGGPRHICAADLATGDLVRLSAEGPVPVEEVRGDDFPLLFGSNPHFVPPHYLVYKSTGSGALVAVRLDPESLELQGESRFLPLRGVRSESYGGMQAEISRSGDLVFASGGNAELSRFVWVGPDGARDTLPFPARAYGAFGLSSDGGHLVANGQSELVWGETWIFDLTAGPPGYLWDDPTVAGGGARFLPNSNRRLAKAGEVIYTKGLRAWEAVDTLGELQGDWRLGPAGPDGRVLVRPGDETGHRYFWLDLTDLPLASEEYPGERSPAFQIRETVIIHPNLSPDGSWLSYVKWPRMQVFAIRSGAESDPVYVADGEMPIWSPLGDALYYRNGQRFYRVPADLDSDEPFGTAELFAKDNFANAPGSGIGVSPDGQRLLLAVTEGGTTTTTLDIVLNFRAHLAEVLGDPGGAPDR
jgi:serine/threonine-protein kinase